MPREAGWRVKSAKETSKFAPHVTRPTSTHLSLEKFCHLFPVKRVEIEVDQFLRHLRLNVLPELGPELLHRQLLGQAGFQL